MKYSNNLLILILGLLLGLLGKGVYDRLFNQTETGMELTLCSTGEETLGFSCAMHNKVYSSTPGNCPICGMKLVDRLTSPLFNPDLIPLDPGQIRQMNILTSSVTINDERTEILHLNGRLEPIESSVYHQVCHLPGRIEKMYVAKEGEKVRMGQPIASVYSKELIAALETYHLNTHAPSLRRSALNNLTAWKVPASFYQEVDMEQDYHKPFDVRSDFTGTVLEVQTTIGDYAVNTHMGHPTILYELADLRSLWAILEVFEDDLQKVRIGQEVDLQFDAFPGEKWKGKVEWVGDVVDPHSRSIPLRVVIENSNGRLKPGMLAAAEIKVHTLQPVLMVPESAVLWTGRRSIVYKQVEGMTSAVFAYREVLVGDHWNGFREIISGLDVEDKVVVQGAFQLDANAQLQGRNCMMNPPVTEVGLADERVARQ